MALPVATPTALTFNASTAGGGPNQSIVGSAQTLSVSEASYTGSFSISVTDSSICYFAQIQNGGGTASWSILAYQAGSTTINITDANGQSIASPVTVTVTLAANPNVAGAYNAATAIAMCYARTNENSTSLPSSTVLTFLNAAIGEISDSLGAVRKYITIPTVAGQNVFNLPYDVQDIISASFSTLAPAGQGTQVYRLEQLEQNTFMDFSGGLPGTGFGPPLAFMAVSDINGFQSFQLYPPAFAGLLNIYYRARPQVFADTTSNSTTNIDPQAQELMIYWTCARICEARERYAIAKIFSDQFDSNLEESRTIIARRTAPKSGQVRDVTSSGRPGMPPWLY